MEFTIAENQGYNEKEANIMKYQDIKLIIYLEGGKYRKI